MDVLLDTCAMIWAILDPRRLSAPAIEVLESPDCAVCFSPVSAGEVACAVERGRIELAEHWKLWLRRHVTANGWTCLPIDLETMEEAYSLPPPFHQDPVDRIIVATARLRRCPVVTGDRNILTYPHVKTLW